MPAEEVHPVVAAFDQYCSLWGFDPATMKPLEKIQMIRNYYLDQLVGHQLKQIKAVVAPPGIFKR